ncbi:MAG: HAMP domain-containing histidine kinase [Saprospiraceae bacterium]|nr:HAMP domain-containing histidine kinase [Bacteroidia bacterium]NNL93827.1 HAMP domain-containing histidine kinase [Saprospiraceae bacterium]
MNKKVIWAIIILMSTALIGIAVTQFVWIKAQVSLDESNFDDRVFTAMNNVKASLKEDASTKDFVDKWAVRKKSLFGQNINFLNKYKSRDQNSLDNLKLESLMHAIDPDYPLLSINRKKLNRYIKSELEDQGIHLKYDYAVYSNKEKEFIIRNGVFAVPLEGNASSPDMDDSHTTGKDHKGMENSPYKVKLFNDDESPGYLKIFFPNKQSYLWAKVLPSMLTSLLFASLILMCFIYTIYVIFRQKKVSEMKTDFINNMTHEFKTPIATISLATDSITNKSVINSEEKVGRFAKIIKQENKRMLNQVEKVLQMARIDKKDFELKLTSVNLNDVVSQAATHSRLKVTKRNGILETKLRANQPNVEGDLTHISNIVHNLLDNAEKYSTDEPKIIISTSNVKGGVELSIKDNGIGMTKESQKHIFDKFYRVHTGNRHDVKGFGLGLSYVKALISAHNGTISVESELGKGSTFILFFPFKQSD